MPLSLARKLARALGNRSESSVREIDDAITGYVRDVRQAGSTAASTIAWNDVSGKPTHFAALVVATETSTSLTISNEEVILADDDTAGAQVDLALPAAADVNYPVRIKKLGSTANVVITADGSETIDGSSSATLTTQYESITLISDGNNWHAF